MAFDGIPWRAAPLTGKGAYLAGDRAQSDALFNALVAAYARERVYARLVVSHVWPRFEQITAGAVQSTDWEPKAEDLSTRATIFQADAWVSETFTHARAYFVYETDIVDRQTTIDLRLSATDTGATTTDGTEISVGVNQSTEAGGEQAITCEVSLSALTKDDNITFTIGLTCADMRLRLKYLVIFLEVRD